MREKRRFLLTSIVILFVLIFSFGFSACKETSDSRSVKFDFNGGVINSATTFTLNLKKGDVVDLSLYVPTKKDYKFVGWSDGTNMYSGQYTVNENVTFTAVWELDMQSSTRNALAEILSAIGGEGTYAFVFEGSGTNANNQTTNISLKAQIYDTKEYTLAFEFWTNQEDKVGVYIKDGVFYAFAPSMGGVALSDFDMDYLMSVILAVPEFAGNLTDDIKLGPLTFDSLLDMVFNMFTKTKVSATESEKVYSITINPSGLQGIVSILNLINLDSILAGAGLNLSTAGAIEWFKSILTDIDITLTTAIDNKSGKITSLSANAVSQDKTKFTFSTQNVGVYQNDIIEPIAPEQIEGFEKISFGNIDMSADIKVNNQNSDLGVLLNAITDSNSFVEGALILNSQLEYRLSVRTMIDIAMKESGDNNLIAINLDEIQADGTLKPFAGAYYKDGYIYVDIASTVGGIYGGKGIKVAIDMPTLIKGVKDMVTAGIDSVFGTTNRALSTASNLNKNGVVELLSGDGGYYISGGLHNFIQVVLGVFGVKSEYVTLTEGEDEQGKYTALNFAINKDFLTSFLTAIGQKNVAIPDFGTANITLTTDKDGIRSLGLNAQLQGGVQAQLTIDNFNIGKDPTVEGYDSLEQYISAMIGDESKYTYSLKELAYSVLEGVELDTDIQLKIKAGKYNISDILSIFGITDAQNSAIEWNISHDITLDATLSAKVALTQNSLDAIVQINLNEDLIIGNKTVQQKGLLLGVYLSDGAGWLDLSNINLFGVALPSFKANIDLGKVLQNLSQTLDKNLIIDTGSLFGNKDEALSVINADGSATALSMASQLSAKGSEIIINSQSFSASVTMATISSILTMLGVQADFLNKLNVDLSASLDGSGLQIGLDASVQNSTGYDPLGAQLNITIKSENFAVGVDNLKETVKAEINTNTSSLTDAQSNVMKALLETVGNMSLTIGIKTSVAEGADIGNYIEEIVSKWLEGVNLNIDIQPLDFNLQIMLDAQNQSYQLRIYSNTQDGEQTLIQINLYKDNAVVEVMDVGTFVMQENSLVQELKERVEQAIDSAVSLDLNEIFEKLLSGNNTAQTVNVEQENEVTESNAFNVFKLLAGISARDLILQIDFTKELVSDILAMVDVHTQSLSASGEVSLVDGVANISIMLGEQDFVIDATLGIEKTNREAIDYNYAIALLKAYNDRDFTADEQDAQAVRDYIVNKLKQSGVYDDSMQAESLSYIAGKYTELLSKDGILVIKDVEDLKAYVQSVLQGFEINANIQIAFNAGKYNILDLVSRFTDLSALGLPEDSQLILSFGEPTIDLGIRLQSSLLSGDDSINSAMAFELVANKALTFESTVSGENATTIIPEGQTIIALYLHKGSLYIDATSFKVLSLSVPVFKVDKFDLGSYIDETVNNIFTTLQNYTDKLQAQESQPLAMSTNQSQEENNGEIALTIEQGRLQLAVSMQAVGTLLANFLTGEQGQTAESIMQALKDLTVSIGVNRYEVEEKGEYSLALEMSGDLIKTVEGNSSGMSIKIGATTENCTIADTTLNSKLNDRLSEIVGNYGDTYSDILRGIADKLFSGSVMIDLNADFNQGKYILNTLINNILSVLTDKGTIDVPIAFTSEDFNADLQIAMQWRLDPITSDLTMMVEVRDSDIVKVGIYLYKKQLLVDLTGVGLINIKVSNVALINDMSKALTDMIQGLQGLDLNELIGGLLGNKQTEAKESTQNVQSDTQDQKANNSWIGQLLGVVMLENANIKVQLGVNLLENIIFALTGKTVVLGEGLFDVKANLGIFDGVFNFDAVLFEDGEQSLITMSINTQLSNEQIVNSAYIPSKYVFESYEIDATDSQTLIKDIINNLLDVRFAIDLSVAFNKGTYNLAQIFDKLGVDVFSGTQLLWTFTRDTEIKLTLEVAIKAYTQDNNGKNSLASIELKADGDIDLGSDNLIKDGTVILGAYAYEGNTYIDASGISLLGITMPVFNIDYDLAGAIIEKLTKQSDSVQETTPANVLTATQNGQTQYIAKADSGQGEIAISVSQQELSIVAGMDAIVGVLSGFGIDLGIDLSVFDLGFAVKVGNGLFVEASGNILSTTDGADSGFKLSMGISPEDLQFTINTDELNAKLADKAEKYSDYNDDVVKTLKNILGKNSVQLDLTIDAQAGSIDIINIISGILQKSGLNLNFPIVMNFDNLHYDLQLLAGWDLESRQIMIELNMLGTINNKTILGLYGDSNVCYIGLEGLGLVNLKLQNFNLLSKIFDAIDNALEGINPIILSEILKEAIEGKTLTDIAEATANNTNAVVSTDDTQVQGEEKASGNDIIKKILSAISIKDSKIFAEFTSDIVKQIFMAIGIESDIVLEAGFEAGIAENTLAGYVNIAGQAQFNAVFAVMGERTTYLPEDESSYIVLNLSDSVQGRDVVKEFLDGFNFALSVDIKSTTVGTVVDSSEEETQYTRLSIEKINGIRKLENHNDSVGGEGTHGILISMYDIDESEYLSHDSGKKTAMMHFYIDYATNKASVYLCSGYFKIAIRVIAQIDIDLTQYLSKLDLNLDVLGMLSPVVDNLIAQINSTTGGNVQEDNSQNSVVDEESGELVGFAKVFANLDINELLRPGVTFNLMNTGVGNVNIKLDPYAFNALIDGLMNCVLGADTQIDMTTIEINNSKMFSKNYLEYMWWDRLAASNTVSAADSGTPYSIWDSIIKQITPIVSDVIRNLNISVAGITLTPSTVNTFLDAVRTAQHLHRIVKRLLPIATFNEAEVNLNMIEGSIANLSFTGTDTGKAIKKYALDESGNWYETQEVLTQTVKSMYAISSNYDAYYGYYYYTYKYGDYGSCDYGGKGIMHRTGYSSYLGQYTATTNSFGNEIQLYNKSESVGNPDNSLTGSSGIVDWGNLSTNITFNPYLYSYRNQYQAAVDEYWKRYFTGYGTAVYQYGTSVKRGTITLTYNNSAFNKDVLKTLMNKSGTHYINATANYHDGSKSSTTINFTVMSVQAGGADSVRSVEPINLHVYESIPDYVTINTYSGKQVKYYVDGTTLRLEGDYQATSPEGGNKTARMVFANGATFNVNINYSDSTISDQSIDMDWYDLDFSMNGTQEGIAQIRKNLIDLFKIQYNDGTYIPQILIDNATWDMSELDSLIMRDKNDLSAGDYQITIVFDKKISQDGKTLVSVPAQLVQEVKLKIQLQGKDKIKVSLQGEEDDDVLHIDPYMYYMYVSTGDEKYNPFPSKANATYSDGTTEQIDIKININNYDILWGYTDNSTARGQELKATVNIDSEKYSGKGWFDENYQIDLEINQNIITAIYFDSQKTQDYVQRGKTYESAYVVFSNGLEMQMPVFVRESGDRAFVYIGFDLEIYEQYGKLSAFTGLNGNFLQAYAVQIR